MSDGTIQIDKPWLGAGVHYVGKRGEHLFALVTAVKGPGVVSVKIFGENYDDRAYNITYSEPQGTRMDGETLIMEQAKPGTWHWPEPEDAPAEVEPDRPSEFANTIQAEHG